MNREAVGLLSLRIGVGGVFLWFGMDKFFHPLIWLQWVPSSWLALIPMSQTVFIYLVGGAESVMGLLILAGLFTRIAAAAMAVHLLFVMSAVGFNEIMVRDAGLFSGAVALALLGPEAWSLDRIWRRTLLRPKKL